MLNFCFLEFCTARKIGYFEGNYELLTDVENALDCMEKVNKYDIRATGFSYYHGPTYFSCYAHYGSSMNSKDDFGYNSCFISGNN